MKEAMMHAGVSTQLEERRSRARARAAAAGSIIYADQPALVRARGHVEYPTSPSLTGASDNCELKHQLLLEWSSLTARSLHRMHVLAKVWN
jgi:hypothetical protein